MLLGGLHLFFSVFCNVPFITSLLVGAVGSELLLGFSEVTMEATMDHWHMAINRQKINTSMGMMPLPS